MPEIAWQSTPFFDNGQSSQCKDVLQGPDRFRINGENKLYFALETKGGERLADLCDAERLKMNCGKKHFEALGSGVEMQVATERDTVRKRI